jgi:hypothetical protein
MDRDQPAVFFAVAGRMFWESGGGLEGDAVAECFEVGRPVSAYLGRLLGITSQWSCPPGAYNDGVEFDPFTGELKGQASASLPHKPAQHHNRKGGSGEPCQG